MRISDWSSDVCSSDLKAFHDTLPSVQRLRSERPMDVLFGDGTAVDLLFQDRDGRQVKLWAILWLDDCTGRLVGHFLPRPRGEGARMEHVALRFAIVCAEIGFPKVVYVDKIGRAHV